MQTDKSPLRPGPERDISIFPWFIFYGAVLAATAVALAWVLHGRHVDWHQWRADPAAAFTSIPPAAKLMLMGMYLSLCGTFLPLPTGWIIAGVATREAAISPHLWITVAAVAAVGAVGSTLANLNDYHLITWMLRHQPIARIRHTRAYIAAVSWFGRAPFFMLTVFSILPVPVDIVRVLAAGACYPRGRFAAANLIGRFCRYGLIAFVTFWYDLGGMAAAALLGLAVVLAAGRLGSSAWKRWLAHRPSSLPAMPAVDTSRH